MDAIKNSTGYAERQGFTREVLADAPDGGILLHFLIKPDADLDGSFIAFCIDEMEYIRVNGWLFEFEIISDKLPV